MDQVSKMEEWSSAALCCNTSAMGRKLASLRHHLSLSAKPCGTGVRPVPRAAPVFCGRLAAGRPRDGRKADHPRASAAAQGPRATPADRFTLVRGRTATKPDRASEPLHARSRADRCRSTCGSLRFDPGAGIFPQSHDVTVGHHPRTGVKQL